jgi:ubiquinone/menaquinone biosynthesis C-methylase UbiE
MDHTKEIQDYWTDRSESYSGTVLDDIREGLADNWMSLLRERMPEGRLKILDIGTGPGFFPMMLGKDGHDVTGIDFSKGMLEVAAENCKAAGVECDLIFMNAEELEFEDETFDMIVSRNVWWTLPHPDKAYEGAMRVLKKGGRIFIFDGESNGRKAAYRPENPTEEEIRKHPYLKYKIPEEMLRRYDEIHKILPLQTMARPEWDISVLRRFGISSVEAVFTDNFEFYPPGSEDKEDWTSYFMLCATKRRSSASR